MSQSSSDCQGEPLDDRRGMDPSLDEELFGAPDIPSTSIGSSLVCTDPGRVNAEAFMSLFPPSIIPTDNSWPGASGVLDEAYTAVPPDLIGPPSQGRRPTNPTTPIDHPSYCQDEPLDEGMDFWLYEEAFGAPDSASLGPPLSYADSEILDTEASVSLPAIDPTITPTNFNWLGDGGFLGEAPDLIGPPSRRATCPTPAVPHPSFHAAASGGPQSQPRRATFPFPSYPTYSIDALHCGWPQRPPLPIFSRQNHMDDTSHVMSPASISHDGPQPIEDTAMSFRPEAFSGPSSHTSVYGPPLSVPVVGNTARIPSAMSISVPPKKMKPTRKRSIPRKPTSQARKRGSTAQSCGGQSTKERARAQLNVESNISYGDGCRLDNVAALPTEFDTVALEGQTFTQKASLRFEIPPHRPFNRQFNVLHRGGRQPTKRRLAAVTARAVERFRVDCAKSGRPCEGKLKHFVLRSIVVDSRSGLRPVFDLTIPATI